MTPLSEVRKLAEAIADADLSAIETLLGDVAPAPSWADRNWEFTLLRLAGQRILTLLPAADEGERAGAIAFSMTASHAPLSINGGKIAGLAPPCSCARYKGALEAIAACPKRTCHCHEKASAALAPEDAVDRATRTVNEREIGRAAEAEAKMASDPDAPQKAGEG